MGPAMTDAPDPRHRAPTADRFVLVVGGARSGKSDFAVAAAGRAGGPTTFVATAEPGDDDMARRIARHRRDRPARWALIEEPLDLAAAVATVDDGHHVIIDCLTLWTANLVFAEVTDTDIVAAAETLSRRLAARTGLSLVVSNEVGLGIHPDNDLSRRYRDLLGRVNRTMAAGADRTLFFVAGRAMALADPFDLVAGLPGPRGSAPGRPS